MIDELVALLGQAADAVEELPELSVYCYFDTPAAFAASLRAIAGRVSQMEREALDDAAVIFLPTGAWDDAMGLSGMDLANRIMRLLDHLRARPGG
jgi:hypothetical protein